MKNILNSVRKMAQPLAGTPFHPQWLLRRGNGKLLNYLSRIERDRTVLDIGCFDKWPKAHISDSCAYIGLDYYETARHLYDSVPDVYGNALELPIQGESINTVLLLDVLEHISDTNSLLSEVYRVLEPNGMLIVQVPFLYPLHDEPRDYIRLTIHGIGELARKFDFSMERYNTVGHPIETSALLTNIALSKTILEWMRARNPAAVLVLLLPLFIFFSNLLARLISTISHEDPFMPCRYQFVFKKQAKGNSG